MNVVATIKSTVRGLVACAALFGLNACAADDLGAVQNETLSGADEGASADSITASYPVGSVLAATANLNLRTGHSTSYHVLVVMPSGSHMTVVNAHPTSGWYNVRYGSTTGWAYGAYLRVVSTPSSGGGSSGGSSSGVDGAITRARAGVGFSYWWGHGRFLMSGATSSNRGSCSGSCPSCSHHGSYGADCSGFVGKVWQVPSSNGDVSSDGHPYSTGTFVGSSSLWHTVTRSSARRGDAFVYNSGGEGHIFLYESGDPWGSMWTYEARGCSYGIVHNLRTASSIYKVIRRTGY
jgi:hypothetical protein